MQDSARVAFACNFYIMNTRASASEVGDKSTLAARLVCGRVSGVQYTHSHIFTMFAKRRHSSTYFFRAYERCECHHLPRRPGSIATLRRDSTSMMPHLVWLDTRGNITALTDPFMNINPQHEKGPLLLPSTADLIPQQLCLRHPRSPRKEVLNLILSTHQPPEMIR